MMADQTRGVSKVGSDFSEEEDDDVSDEGSKHLNFKTPYSAEEFELIFLGRMESSSSGPS